MPKIKADLKKSTLSYIAIGILSLSLLLSALLCVLAVMRSAKLGHKISAQCERISRFARTTKMPIVQDSIDFLDAERERLKNLHGRFSLALASPLSDTPSEESLEPLMFKERLVQIQKKLRQDATQAGMALPDSLGFSEYETRLSEKDEIPGLLKRLKVLEEVIYLAADSGINAIGEVDFPMPDTQGKDKKKAPGTVKKRVRSSPIPSLPGPMDRGPARHDETAGNVTDNDVFGQIPFETTFRANSPEMMTFLYKLRRSPYNVVITDFSIVAPDPDKENDPETLSVTLHCTAMELM